MIEAEGGAGGSLVVKDCGPIFTVSDRGSARRGGDQSDADIVESGTILIEKGRISDIARTETIAAFARDHDIPIVEAQGRAVLPGLIEAHSHPLFGGRRGREYNMRLGGATLQEIAQQGGGILSSVLATRASDDGELLDGTAAVMREMLLSGVTTLETKSGYGLTLEEELRELRLLRELRADDGPDLVVSFLGAHVVPPEFSDSESYVPYVAEILERAVSEGLVEFHDITVERGYFREEDAQFLADASKRLGIPVKIHADAWATSGGWGFAVRNGVVSADHLTYTTPEQVVESGPSETIAVLLPVAELIYMTDRRAPARAFIDTGVPVAISTDYCSSINAFSATRTLTLAAPWFGLTVEESIVAMTLNAAYAIGRGHDRGSIDRGKRGDLLILDTEDPYAYFLALGESGTFATVKEGRFLRGPRG